MIYAAFLYGNQNGHLDLSALIASFRTKEFAYFLAFYYAYYFTIATIIIAVATLIFKVDYTNIQLKQLRREARLTVEAVTTYVICFWCILQLYPSWNTNTSVLEIAKSFEQLLGRERLDGRWLACGPFVFGANNVWGWYLSIFLILFEALMGHSRLPFTLEHATHHVAYNKNYGFYSDWNVRVNWDKVFGSWAYSSSVAKISKVYPKELSNYTWNDEVRRINWGGSKTV